MFEVDAGLYREDRIGHDLADIVGFEVVHVGAGAVDVLGDGVSCAVDEVVAEAGGCDDFACGVVDFEAVEHDGLLSGRLCPVEGGVSCGCDDAEDVVHLGGDGGATEASPGDVVIDGTGSGELSPHVEEEEIVGTDRECGGFAWFVVRVCGVGVDGYDGAVVGEEAFPLHACANPALELVFGEGSIVG